MIEIARKLGSVVNALAGRSQAGAVNKSESSVADSSSLVAGTMPLFGTKVQASNARTIELVYSAANLLVSSLSTLPMSLLGGDPDAREVQRGHWAHYRVHTEPYPGWTPSHWFGAFWLNAIVFNNAVAYIDRSERRFKFIPWHQVNHESRVGGDRYYIGDGSVWLPESDVIHVQGPSMSGHDGTVPV